MSEFEFMNCVVCGTPLVGRQTKFCSNECRNKETNRQFAESIKKQHPLTLDDVVDRNEALDRQRKAFGGYTLRELAANRELPAPPKRAKGEHKMIKLYRQLLGKESRDEAV
jgi:hypothetical protein